MQNTTKPLSVLVVDDDQLIRLACSKILKRENFSVLEADNGVSALQIFKSQRPAEVITDILMPEKEGLETIAEIKQIAPQTKILAISGGGSTQNMSFLELAEKLGADATLDKPIKPAKLLDTLQHVLKGSSC